MPEPLTPESFIAEVRAAGLNIAPHRETFGIGHPEGLGDGWTQIARRYVRAKRADPQFAQKLDQALRREVPNA